MQIMKQEDKQYEEWLEQLKRIQPVLNDPEALTNNILQRITDRTKPKNKKHHRTLFGWLSGVAATVLLCLSIHEIYFTSTSLDLNTSAYEWEQIENDLSQEWDGMSMREKGKFLSSFYKKRSMEKRGRNYQNIQDKFLKRLSYENK